MAFPAPALAGTSDVAGAIRSQQISGPDCTSPVGLCTKGTFSGSSGSIRGPFTFSANRLVPSDVPGVLLYTGRIDVHTSGGDFVCTDSGAFNTAGDGELADVCEVGSGTGEWSSTSGYLQIVGTFTAAAGGKSRYAGKVTTP